MKGFYEYLEEFRRREVRSLHEEAVYAQGFRDGVESAQGVDQLVGAAKAGLARVGAGAACGMEDGTVKADR